MYLYCLHPVMLYDEVLIQTYWFLTSTTISYCITVITLFTYNNNNNNNNTVNIVVQIRKQYFSLSKS